MTHQILDKKRMLICLVLLTISLLIMFKFFVLGCLVSLGEQLRFALGNTLYVLSLIFLINFQQLTLKLFFKYLPVFFLLNIVAYFLTLIINRVFAQILISIGYF